MPLGGHLRARVTRRLHRLHPIKQYVDLISTHPNHHRMIVGGLPMPVAIRHIRRSCNALICTLEPDPCLLNNVAPVPLIHFAKGIVARNLVLTRPGAIGTKLALQRRRPALLEEVQRLCKGWRTPCSFHYSTGRTLRWRVLIGMAGKSFLQHAQRLMQRSVQCDHTYFARSQAIDIAVCVLLWTASVPLNGCRAQRSLQPSPEVHSGAPSA